MGVDSLQHKGFHGLPSQLREYLKWFKYTINLTHDEAQKRSMFATYKKYLRIQAESDANEELRTLDELLSVNTSRISGFENRMKQIDDARIAHQEERKRLEKDLADKQFDKQSDGEFTKGTAIAAAIAIIIAIILFANGKILWGLICRLYWL